MSIEYGKPPRDLGHFDVRSAEMMFYLYLPVKMPGIPGFRVPHRLLHCMEMLHHAWHDASETIARADLEGDHHVYLTAKTLFVEPGAPGNRPGWHADGFGSDGDLNYIWSDMNPTEFAVQDFDIRLGDRESIEDMEAQARPECIITYPDKHLLRLDEGVVHRVAPAPAAGVRTFIKISVSRHRYNLKGNSRNWLFRYTWPLHDRAERRNVDNKDFAV